MDIKIELQYISNTFNMMNVSELTLKQHYIDLSQFNINEDIVLAKISHKQPITVLDLTDAENCMLLYFDEDSIFKGASVHIKQGVFMQSIQYKQVLICSYPLSFQAIGLKSMIQIFE